MPDFGAMQPFMGRVQAGVQKGREILDNPWGAIREMVLPPMPSPHDAAVEQMNAEQNSHLNDAANQSFLPRRVPRAIQK